jgi:hypothetical protein
MRFSCFEEGETSNGTHSPPQSLYMHGAGPRRGFPLRRCILISVQHTPWKRSKEKLRVTVGPERSSPEHMHHASQMSRFRRRTRCPLRRSKNNLLDAFLVIDASQRPDIAVIACRRCASVHVTQKYRLPSSMSPLQLLSMAMTILISPSTTYNEG